MKKIAFTKMHGLGNDFVIIDQNDLPNGRDIEKLAKFACNRHTGIGCDQFITYLKQGDDYRMTIHNHDGSKAEICGNAARCVAKLIYLNNGEKNINFKITDRDLKCLVISNNDISVNMGNVSFKAPWMPKADKMREVAERYMIDSKDVMCVDVSNPHLVLFSNLSHKDKELLGKEFENSALFPEGVNVNFASIENDVIKLLVWERGTGFTLACGSGACASFAASYKLGFVSSEAIVEFELGRLIMSQQNDDVIMRGAATLVGSGEFYYG